MKRSKGYFLYLPSGSSVLRSTVFAHQLPSSAGRMRTDIVVHKIFSYTSENNGDHTR